jgi:hypothetical protein
MTALLCWTRFCTLAGILVHSRLCLRHISCPFASLLYFVSIEAACTAFALLCVRSRAWLSCKRIVFRHVAYNLCGPARKPPARTSYLVLYVFLLQIELVFKLIAPAACGLKFGLFQTCARAMLKAIRFLWCRACPRLLYAHAGSPKHRALIFICIQLFAFIFHAHLSSVVLPRAACYACSERSARGVFFILCRWLVPSRLPVSRPAARRPVSNWPRRLRASQRPRLAA